jgi:hypothetical protein
VRYARARARGREAATPAWLRLICDISTSVQFDVLRNQIVRIIDVMLDPNPQLGSPLSKRVP